MPEPGQPSSDTHPHASAPALPLMAIAALGIVFGDIATSPLYALQEAFGEHGVRPEAANVLGVLSLTLWSLIGVVSLKYVLLIMRADNKGEGGIMALLALARHALRERPHLQWCAVMIGLVGAALFFGDSVITPAISVLSAVEGLKLAAPGLDAWIVPLSVLILFGLFSVQKFGTARVGVWFGPIMLVWLIVIGVIGLAALLQRPAVLGAIDPRHAIEFFLRNGFAGFTTLGATVLVLTGAEALYADMGHFGPRPIRVAWIGVALPCLMLSYFGQGALILGDPLAASGPFYRLVPTWALYPMIGLATVATVIASQAVISGAYSMIREGVQLGYLPRMRVLQTSSQVRGQIYLPAINTALLLLVLAATLGFRSSSALAASFGIAVSGTMLMTTLLVLIVARLSWGWPLIVVVPLAVLLLIVDCAFVGANLMKLGSGGWFPLALGAMGFVIMVTWRRGRELLVEQIRRNGVPLETCVRSMIAHPPAKVRGTAVFLTTAPEMIPQALLHNLKHNKVLHERNVIFNVEVLDAPYADSAARVHVEALGGGFLRISARFGFAEDPDILTALDACGAHGLSFEMMDTTFFTSRENLVSGGGAGMSLWRDRLFGFMARNAMPATAYFRIPDDRLIEIGRRVAI